MSRRVVRVGIGGRVTVRVGFLVAFPILLVVRRHPLQIQSKCQNETQPVSRDDAGGAKMDDQGSNDGAENNRQAGDLSYSAVSRADIKAGAGLLTPTGQRNGGKKATAA